ncbi:MAG: RNA polymerase sigma factor, partial [Methylococcales bacterium]|nr:RNA polymerase sigma factor [Methylococcales bacterium]
SLQTWLLRSLYYLFVDTWRKSKRTPVDQSDWLDEQTHTDILNHDPLEKASSHESLDRLQQALEELTREYRVVIVLHDMEGHTLTHISREIDVPLGTLKSRLHRARKQLREILTEVEPFSEQFRVNP